MINTYARGIIKHKKDQSIENSQKILEAIKSLGVCSTKEIRCKIDNDAQKILNEKFEKGEFIRKAEDSPINQHTIRRETIQRKLKILLKEGLIKKNNGKYSLTEATLSDLRLFNPGSGKHFGNGLLDCLLKLHYPTINDFKTNIKELVDILGFYLLYLIMETCRPLEIKNTDKAIENLVSDTLTQKWLESAIDPLILINSFISVVTNQYTDKQRRKYFTTHSKRIGEDEYSIQYINNPPDPINDPMSSSDFRLIRFYNFASEEAQSRYNTARSPNYEVEEKTIDKIYLILKELYPNYYSEASFVRYLAMEAPKGKSLK